MDIVSRLKTFINYLGIPVTQFADNCQIARPTLSQLLNGRNNKVSDKLIGKIHEVYPQLSVLWLMFGEGDMLHGENIKISEPKEPSIFDITDDQPTVSQPLTPSIDFGNSFTENRPENFQEEIGQDFKQVSPQTVAENVKSSPLESLTQGSNKSINFNPTSGAKKIVNIIVYYDDNSFESFVPNPNK